MKIDGGNKIKIYLIFLRFVSNSACTFHAIEQADMSDVHVILSIVLNFKIY